VPWVDISSGVDVAQLLSTPMAPLFNTYDVQYAGSKGGSGVYKGKVDPKWSIGRWVLDNTVSAIVKLTYLVLVSCMEVRIFCVCELGNF